MSDAGLVGTVLQVVAVAAVFAVAVLPYVVFGGARRSLAFCVKLAGIEALLFAGWYVFGSAIVMPVTLAIVVQGLAFGFVVAASAFGGWLLFRRLKGALNG